MKKHSTVLFTVSLIYLIIEIGYKGYALSLLGDTGILPFEIESLEYAGRYISSFGFALFAFGLIKDNDIRFKFFMAVPVFFLSFFLQKTLFSNIHLFASNALRQQAYHINLVRSVQPHVEDDTNPFYKDYKISDSAKKAYLGTLPIVLYDSKYITTIPHRIQKTYIQTYEELRAKRLFSEEQIFKLRDEHYYPSIYGPLWDIVERYNMAKLTKFDDVYYAVYAPAFEHYLTTRFKSPNGGKLWRGLPQQIKRDIEQIESLKKQKKTPPISLLDRTFTAAMSYLEKEKAHTETTLSSEIERRYGSQLNVSAKLPYYAWSRKNGFGVVGSYRALHTHYQREIDEALYYALETYFGSLYLGRRIRFMSDLPRDPEFLKKIANLREITRGHATGEALLKSRGFYELAKSFPEFIIPEQIGYAKNSSLIWNHLMLYVNESQQYRRIYRTDKEIEPKEAARLAQNLFRSQLTLAVIEQQTGSKNDTDFQVRSILIPPIVLILSLFAVLLNCIGLIVKMYQSEDKRWSIALALLLGVIGYSQAYPYLDSDIREYQATAIEDNEFSATRIAMTNVIIGTSQVSGVIFKPIEIAFSKIMQLTLEQRIIDQRRAQKEPFVEMEQIKLDGKR